MEVTCFFMEQLLVTKERYGYMACPCRLAMGTVPSTGRFVCPCVYREADVAEYGAFFADFM